MEKREIKSPKKLEKEYFKEALSWDEDKAERIIKSEKRAWRISGVLAAVSFLEAIALTSLVPLKSVEPFVIRVDNNTGMTDVVSRLAGTDGEIEESAQEALDKHWLSQYVRYRERYQWETRETDRKIIGLMSSTKVEQVYSSYTDPIKNKQAPITVYGKTAEVRVKVNGAISFLPSEKVDGIKYTTAIVRYSKEVGKAGERNPRTYWTATITFVYLSSSMNEEDRRLNPLGFQVTNYRNDQETTGE